MANLVTRIPSEELESCKEWLIPEVKSKNIIPSIKKEKRSQRSSTNDKSQNQVVEQKSQTAEQEVIETVVDEDIAPITAEQLQKITEEAEKEGYDKGYEKGFSEAQERGYEEGIEQSKKDILEQSEHLQHIIDALINPLKNEQATLEKQLLDIICQLTAAVVQAEMQTDSSHIVEVVKQALGLLPAENHQLTLYLNDQDVDLVNKSLTEPLNDLSYQVDNTLLPGGCRLESHESSIDFSVEQRLQQVIDDFLHKRYVSEDENNVVAEKGTEKELDDDIEEAED